MRYGDGNDQVALSAAVSGTTVSPFGYLDSRDILFWGLQLLTDGTVVGSWKIEVSQDSTPAVAMGAVEYGQASGQTGDWTDITALWTPTIVAVTVTAGTKNQYVEKADFGGRKIRISFTPTSGSGNARALCYGKGYG
jgi:hypothetical protein